ncbi:MAG: hypothetical protein ISS71_05795 [Phycisphaerae bacterium]|nr:hypothetical protein [Phycisphaerae bacterium]
MKQTSAFILMALTMALLSGCPAPPTETSGDMTCPGKSTIGEAVRLLALQKQNIQSLEAAAECTISWREADDEEKDENVPGKLIFVPPDKIYFGGSKFGEVRFGTNETEFWLRVEPELDTYWWGTKAQAAGCREGLLLNPADVAEAFGIVDVTTDWKLLHRDNYDILDLYKDGKRAKRVYINTCDYHIEQIEYFGADELKKVSIELSDYTLGANGIVVPSRIWVGYFDREGIDESSVEIRLKHIRYFPPEKQGKKLFVRPGRDGYKEVFRLSENCEFELVLQRHNGSRN